MVERTATLLVANLGSARADLALPGPGERWRIEATSREEALDADLSRGRLALPPMTAALLLERREAGDVESQRT
jgi:hypothetical protein